MVRRCRRVDRFGRTARPSHNAPGEVRAITDDLVVDLDADGRGVRIAIQHASRNLDVRALETDSLPSRRDKFA